MEPLRTIPRIARGLRIGGTWTVERVMDETDELTAVLVASVTGGRALAFILGPDAPEPSLDAAAAETWGASRTVIRDEQLGPVVVDVLSSEAELLSERMEDGRAIPETVVEDLAERARAEHRAGRAHGRLLPQYIALGAEGIEAAGWGLLQTAGLDAASRDLADLAALAASAAPASPTGETAKTGREPPLHAAVVSEHLPTLKRAVAAAEADPDTVDPADLLRAQDALRRLEKRVGECLERARTTLAGRDPLGAVAACREAIRYGAEEEAGPMLRLARRQAKELLEGKSRLPAIPRPVVAGLVGVLALIVLVGWWVASGDGAPSAAEQVTRAATERGERGAMRMLVALRDRGEIEPDSSLMLERMDLLVASETQRLLQLRREAIAEGARPLDADAAAEQGLDDLRLLKADMAHPALETRLQRALAKVDRAGAMYRARTPLGADQAMRAVELMIAVDPAFVRPDSVGGTP